MRSCPSSWRNSGFGPPRLRRRSWVLPVSLVVAAVVASCGTLGDATTGGESVVKQADAVATGTSGATGGGAGEGATGGGAGEGATGGGAGEGATSGGAGEGTLLVTDGDARGRSATAAEAARVEEVLVELSTEERIGQLLMPAVYGQSDRLGSADAAANAAAHGAPTPSEIVARHRLGGLIYLPENIASADQVRTLSDSLQATARSETGIGLLISVDQEGGRVSRLTDEVSAVPAAAELSGQVEAILKSSYVTGQQVRQQGINVVLAPVADVVTPEASTFISDRSYGSDPDAVAEAVVAAIDGLQQSGVAAAVKHWPGHGATGVDSHDELPSVDVDRVGWGQREAVPFLAALDQDVAMVLVGHLALPQLDPSGQPATVSRVLIEELLRNEFGYEGIVITDALNMGAVARYDEGELVVGAFLAGNDILLMPPSTTVAAEALQRAVADGRITEERLAESVRRILLLKLRLGLLADG